MNENKVESTEFLLGQILAKVSNTDGNVARLVWRADNIETRVELLESAEAGRVAAAAKPKSLWDIFGERVIWAVATAIVSILVVSLGLKA